MTNVCSQSGEKNGTLEVKIEVVSPDADASVEQGGGMHGLRCQCAECLAERQQIRAEGLFKLKTERYDGHDEDRWADVSWDSPARSFPSGSNGSDGGEPRFGDHDDPITADKIA